MRLPSAAFMSSMQSSRLWFACCNCASLGISEAVPVKGQNVAVDGGSLSKGILSGEVPVGQCVQEF